MPEEDSAGGGDGAIMVRERNWSWPDGKKGVRVEVGVGDTWRKVKSVSAFAEALRSSSRLAAARVAAASTEWLLLFLFLSSSSEVS